MTCHNSDTFFASGDPRRFSDVTSAYNFARARSVANNPGGSLLLQKATGSVTHGGGAPWTGAGAGGATAATNWINGGRGAWNALNPPRPWAAHQPRPNVSQPATTPIP
jgi:hypothetical protein